LITHVELDYITTLLLGCTIINKYNIAHSYP
jgi:hypothetical protein